MQNVPIVPEAPMHVCPKIEASPAREQKESFRIQGTEDKENKPVKVARSTLVPTVKNDDITDTDEDLVTQLEQDKQLSPKKVPFSNSPSRSNKPLRRLLKGNSRKPHYNLITAQKIWKVGQDATGIKRQPQEDEAQFACRVWCHVKSFNDASLAR
jgi:hypothetical protein